MNNGETVTVTLLKWLIVKNSPNSFINK
jgi:hypothetical protein